MSNFEVLCPKMQVSKNFFQNNALMSAPAFSKKEEKYTKKAHGARLLEEAAKRRHETYAKLAANCALDDGEKYTDNYRRVAFQKNEKTGFNCVTYKNERYNEVVLAFRCTDNKEGVKSDVKMVEGELPYQYKDALEAYKNVREEYPNSKITVIGHSLGGSLAQLVAATYGEADAVAFDPYGTGEIIKKQGLKDNKNCITYATKGSVVSGVTPHPGEVKTVEVLTMADFEQYKKAEDVVKKLHSLDNYSDLVHARYANEAEIEQSREEACKKLIKPIGGCLKVVPMSEGTVSKFFFNDDCTEGKKLNLAG